MPPRDPILAAKLGVHARSARLVDRPRLRSLLEGWPEARLVLVSAPAGFGKTTVLADWLGTADVCGAWLSLDRGDNDVARFARYLVAAVHAAVDRRIDAPGPDAGGPFDAELALARVLDAIGSAVASAPAGGVVLALDDYHLIEEPAVHRLLAALLERLPADARLAIATRADPPLALARLRARGELLEVRADELRFTAQEAGELLAGSGAELTDAEVGTLTERTEGWAAALRLAGVSLRGRADRDELVARFGASHRFVLDYIIEEVLAGLEPDVQGFLLRTSILDRMSGALCDAVTGRSDGQERLEELERANLLIAPLDDERRWYRYHALFAEILRARLAAAAPDEVPGLHARASAWHEAEGQDDEAIAHAMLSGDLKRTAWIVSMASGRHLNAGEIGTVRRWLDALPDELVRGHAQLSASYAWCLMVVNEPDEMEERLDDAARAFASGADGGAMLRSGIPVQLAILRARLAGLRGDAETAVVEARQAIELVPAELPPEAVANLRGTATVLLAVSLVHAGDLDAAERAYDEGIPELRRGGNVLALGRAIADVARLAIDRGDAARAVRLLEAELRRADEPSSAAESPSIWAALAAARAAQGQPRPAEAAAMRALDLGTRFGDGPAVRSAQATLESIAPALARDGACGDARPRVFEGPSGTVEVLTPREVEVLRLVARGRSNSQIADELFVTVGTVKSHVHAISGKLGAANRVEAVVRGRELGFID
jgi:LuxR family maltose regulon positive regulatory protein